MIVSAASPIAGFHDHFFQELDIFNAMFLMGLLLSL